MSSLANRTVLFDLDGTIADTIPLIVATYQRTVRTVLGWEPTFEQCKQWIGRSLRETCIGLAPERVDELMQSYLEWNLANHRDYVRPFPGVGEVLDDLAGAGRTYGVATSKRYHSAVLSLECAGLTGRIPLLATEENTTTHKPSPEPLLFALARAGVEPADAVYVGDAVVDMQAAKAAGMASIAVTWGVAEAGELAAERPTEIVDSVDELRDLLGL